ncbi:uncharacterized protein SOCE26_051400 [Sorangium cellulosum]|uniref:Uncharacterized protein n=1 Tax=Sorangium cellulosum TaxID=56 RepID=A0A2L0EWK9_SORCE|nr:hypothetical protein [Sorangium cellulosum]AUX43688.1 uncharacterized protein SOCE26_051400 [Sorangium cellulosum]
MTNIKMDTTTKMPPRQPTRDNDALTRAAKLTLADDYALTRAAQLTLRDNALSEGARQMNELTGGSLRAGLDRCHPASLRGMADGVRAAVPPGVLPLVAPTASASDEAREIFNRCADAAEKVHGTGKYARTS